MAGALAVAPAAAAPKATPKAAAAKCPESSGKIQIGITYFGSVGQAFATIGGQNADLVPGDRAIVDGYNKSIDALNADGGIAGCQVEAVIANFPSQTTDFNQESQKVCSTFTQDNDVVAVYNGAYETKVAVDCYAKAKIPYFAVGGKYQPSCDDLKKYEGFLYFEPGVGSCRMGSFIGMWDKAGLFPKDAKVGILVSDDGTGQSQYVADKVWGPALKKLKVPFEKFTYHQSMFVQDFANTSSSLAAGILRFKNEGVNVVLFTPAGPAGVAAWMPQAIGQEYFPAYGFTSADGVATGGAFGQNGIKKGIAISWLVADLPGAVQQTLPTNSAIDWCATWSAPTTVGVSGASAYCDYLNFLREGFAGAKKIDAATLAKGANALGSKFVSSIHYNGATDLSAGHNGGASEAQILTWNPETKAWELSAAQKAVTIP